MEGVVSRSGRTSSRYGPATVFSGPVRKWKKRWVPVSPSNHHNTSNGSINHHNPSSSSHINRNGIAVNGTSSSNGNNNSSHLLLYKWTALSQANCNNSSNHGSPADHSNGDNNSGKDDDSDPHEPPRRKFKYVPVDLLERQKEEAAAKEAAEKEAAEKANDEAKLIELDPTTEETVHKAEDLDEKPDINDTPMEEIQDDEQGVRQDLNESTLDLSLGLNSGDGESDSKPEKT